MYTGQTKHFLDTSTVSAVLLV